MSSGGFTFDQDICADLSMDCDLEVSHDFTSTLDISYTIGCDLDFEGNTAILCCTVGAEGEDSCVEVYASVLTCEGSSSQVCLTVLSACGDSLA